VGSCPQHSLVSTWAGGVPWAPGCRRRRRAPLDRSRTRTPHPPIAATSRVGEPWAARWRREGTGILAGSAASSAGSWRGSAGSFVADSSLAGPPLAQPFHVEPLPLRVGSIGLRRPGRLASPERSGHRSPRPLHVEPRPDGVDGCSSGGAALRLHEGVGRRSSAPIQRGPGALEVGAPAASHAPTRDPSRRSACAAVPVPRGTSSARVALGSGGDGAHFDPVLGMRPGSSHHRRNCLRRPLGATVVALLEPVDTGLASIRSGLPTTRRREPARGRRARGGSHETTGGRLRAEARRVSSVRTRRSTARGPEPRLTSCGAIT